MGEIDCKGLSKESFIETARQIRGDRYVYDECSYIDKYKPVAIKCREHGLFLQYPQNHLNGANCPKCNVIYSKRKRWHHHFLLFIKKSEIIHSFKYDYSLVIYRGTKIDVKIICPIHGIFEQTPLRHLAGCGCRKCSWIDGGLKHRLGNAEFIKRSREIHGDKYNYDSAMYINTCVKVDIICPKHGVFKQSPYVHWSGSGCPRCHNSHGENHIEQFLRNHNISFVREKTFDECKIKNCMRFDFFIPKYNLIIEYHGSLHYIPMKTLTGMRKLMESAMRDEYKERWAINNGFIFKKYLYIQKKEDIEKDLLKIILK
jgi:hypothetical protein